MTLNLPLIISASGDITVFDSVEKAESYFDPYDVHSLIGFDSQGKILEFNIRKEVKRVVGIPTNLEKLAISVKDEPADEGNLRRIIVEYLSRVRSVNQKPFLQKDWNQFSLPAIIDIVREISSSE
jgi:hypothetical protein